MAGKCGRVEIFRAKGSGALLGFLMPCFTMRRDHEKPCDLLIAAAACSKWENSLPKIFDSMDTRPDYQSENERNLQIGFWRCKFTLVPPV